MYKKGKIELICPTCKTIFYRWRCQVEKGSGKFCSRKCIRRSDDYKKNLSDKYSGKGNPYWGGVEKSEKGSFKLSALHISITKQLPKPKYCNCCRKVTPIDLANISQKYKKDLSDWEWLCRKCHMIKDGRLEKLNANRRGLVKPLINCKICDEKKKNKAYGYCLQCYEKIRYYSKQRKNQTQLNNLSFEDAVKIVKRLLNQ